MKGNQSTMLDPSISTSKEARRDLGELVNAVGSYYRLAKVLFHFGWDVSANSLQRWHSGRPMTTDAYDRLRKLKAKVLASVK